MSLPQYFSLYVAVVGGLVFAIYVVVQRRELPNLVDVFQIVLAVAAISAGVSLCAKALTSRTKLGDLEDARLTVLLGGFAVAWVAMTTIVDIVRRHAMPQPKGARARREGATHGLHDSSVPSAGDTA